MGASATNLAHLHPPLQITQLGPTFLIIFYLSSFRLFLFKTTHIIYKKMKINTTSFAYLDTTKN